MVKKVKRFIVFLLFSFFYSLLSGKSAEAAGNNKICIIPKTSSGKLLYNGKAITDKEATDVASDECYN